MIGVAMIGDGDGHTAGRRLLAEMYRNAYGTEMPPIQITDRGKPYFVGNPVYFSLSHTPKRVFCVLSDRPVGIDAEERDRPIRLKLAEKILSPMEKAQFDRAEDKRAALLKFWVLKEATVKCTGTGLQGYPDHTAFSLNDPRLTVMDGCYVAVIEE